MALDIIILAVLLAAVVIGFCKGFLSQIGQIAGLIVGVIACRTVSPVLIEWLLQNEEPSSFTYAASYIVVFVVAYLVVYLLVRLIRSAVHALKLGVFDRLAGVVFKVLFWQLLLSIAFNVVVFITNDRKPFEDANHPWREVVLDFAPTLLGFVSDSNDIPNKEDVKGLLNGI